MQHTIQKACVPLLLLLIGMLALTLFPTTAQAQEVRSFPQTGYQVRGRFLDYWQQNGGLDVFGYPLTNEYIETGRRVQYFERARFEYAPENDPPYDVLLGRLGVTTLEQQGRTWKDLPTSSGPATGCLWFESTQHNVCNQLADEGVGFLNYWRTHGLEFDGQPGKSYAESLALFGVPITEPFVVTLNGKETQVQYFERARFEWHLNNPTGYQVLLGRLGTRLVDGQLQPPQVSQVQISFIALGDQGLVGPEIGCGDSVVPVTVNIEPTAAPLTAAFEQLLAIDETYYGRSGLYNPLHKSELTLDSATVDQGQATIYLSGAIRIAGGTCENPRLEAQIRQTADQFSTVGESVVYINGRRLDNIVSLRQ